MPNERGLYTEEEVKEMGKPVFDYTQGDELGMSIDLWTYTDIKKIFGWDLSKEYRKSMVRAFLKRPRMLGYAPLYSLKDVMDLYLGWSYDYKPSSDIKPY